MRRRIWGSLLHRGLIIQNIVILKVNLMFEGFFAEVLTSFSKGISGVGFELGIILQAWHSPILMF